MRLDYIREAYINKAYKDFSLLMDKAVAALEIELKNAHLDKKVVETHSGKVGYLCAEKTNNGRDVALRFYPCKKNGDKGANFQNVCMSLDLTTLYVPYTEEDNE